MMWNSLISSYRFIAKGKTFTVINLTGLVAGLTVSFFLLIFLINELSMNSGFPGNNRIFRLLAVTEKHVVPQVPYLLPPMLAAGLPEIESSGRMIPLSSFTGTVSVKKDERFTDEPGFICADPSILHILSIRLIQMDSSADLDAPATVFLSSSMANLYFGREDPIGKPLDILSAGIPFTLTIRGVFQPLPWNSSVRIDWITGMDLFEHMATYVTANPDSVFRQMEDFTAEAFVKFRDPRDKQKLLDSLPAFIRAHGLSRTGITYDLQNIREMYLGSERVENDFHLRGNKSSLWSYAFLALFILALAGFNYSILSAARSTLRFKEVGVRKVLGATRPELRAQVLTESTMLAFLAFPLSFLVLGIIEPFADHLYGYHIELYTANMLIYIPLFAAITLFIGFASGSYLAFYLSALNPLDALKSKVFTGRKFSLGRILIVIQLFITLSLLISGLIVFAQIRHCFNMDFGFDTRNLHSVAFDPSAASGYPELKKRLRQERAIQDISGASNLPPSEASSFMSFTLPTRQVVSLENNTIDAGFFKTLGATLTGGRDFDPDLPEDRSSGIILNVSAVHALKLSDPIGKRLGPFRVIGIVNDFNTHSLYQEIKPSVYRFQPQTTQFMLVRSVPGMNDEAERAIRKHWGELFPGTPAEFPSFRDQLNKMYSREQKFGQVVVSFAILAFIITGMGLFGLALLLAERKTKELAIRRIYGARHSQLLFRMLREFVVYLAIASLCSVPVTGFLMNRWLTAFFYRIDLPWLQFLLAILAVTIFVSSIILLRTWTVLRKNLIIALRYE